MTNNKQQTAVEFYLDKIFDIIGDDILDKLSIEQINKIHDLSKQAKEMEKERMIEFANNCIKQIEVSDTCELLMVESPKELYEQTYGGGEQ
jgi:hypothetical protein